MTATDPVVASTEPDATVAEAAGRDLGENLGEGGALLLDRLRVVEVLVAEVLDGGRQVSEED